MGQRIVYTGGSGKDGGFLLYNPPAGIDQVDFAPRPTVGAFSPRGGSH
jgi:hypothetical protein